jgi:hypothetical protein
VALANGWIVIISHTREHNGNVVTYLPAKGLPPCTHAVAHIFAVVMSSVGPGSVPATRWSWSRSIN